MTTDGFERIRNKYLASLPTKAYALKTALDASQGLSIDTQRVAALLHKLCGSAGFYGEDSIAQAAQDLERRVLEEPTDSSRRQTLCEDVEELVCHLNAMAPKDRE